MQIKQKRWIRTVWTMLFYLLCGAILFLYGYGYWKNRRFLLIGVVLLLMDNIGILLIGLFKARQHNLSKGMKYACLHNKMEKALIQALYDDGYYVEREILFKKCAVIPRLEITISAQFDMVSDPIKESVRISRVDMTADYFNYDIDLNELYDALSKDKITVRDHQDRKRVKNLSFIGKQENIETIYIGSKSTNTRSFLRIYDKRKEQLTNNGFRIEEANKCRSWIRFEAVYKGSYAHSISETILSECMDAVSFNKFIAHTILQKYRFADVNGKYTRYTTDLLLVADGEIFPSLVCVSPRDNALRQNIQHILCGSGLFPTIYKIEKIYGEDAKQEFALFLYQNYESMFWLSNGMKRELDIWLQKHEDLRHTKLSDNY